MPMWPVYASRPPLAHRAPGPTTCLFVLHHHPICIRQSVGASGLPLPLPILSSTTLVWDVASLAWTTATASSYWLSTSTCAHSQLCSCWPQLMSLLCSDPCHLLSVTAKVLTVAPWPSRPTTASTPVPLHRGPPASPLYHTPSSRSRPKCHLTRDPLWAPYIKEHPQPPSLLQQMLCGGRDLVCPLLWSHMENTGRCQWVSVESINGPVPRSLPSCGLSTPAHLPPLSRVSSWPIMLQEPCPLLRKACLRAGPQVTAPHHSSPIFSS